MEMFIFVVLAWLGSDTVFMAKSHARAKMVLCSY